MQLAHAAAPPYRWPHRAEALTATREEERGGGQSRAAREEEGKRGFVSCVRFLFARFFAGKPPRGRILLVVCTTARPGPFVERVGQVVSENDS